MLGAQKIVAARQPYAFSAEVGNTRGVGKMFPRFEKRNLGVEEVGDDQLRLFAFVAQLFALLTFLRPSREDQARNDYDDQSNCTKGI